MIFMHIGFGLMTAVAVALYVANRRLIKSLQKASDSLKETNKKYGIEVVRIQIIKKEERKRLTFVARRNSLKSYALFYIQRKKNHAFLHFTFLSLQSVCKKLKEANEKLKTSREHELEYLDSIHNRVVVVERAGYFSIFRESKRGRILITSYRYNQFDPDDRDYIRIHAEEVADKLNEKP